MIVSFFRLIEEIKEKLNLVLLNEDVFMAPVFSEFCEAVVSRSRGVLEKEVPKYSAITVNSNNLNVTFPHQLFINNKFMDSESGKTVNCINPFDESVICKVSSNRYGFFIPSIPS